MHTLDTSTSRRWPVSNPRIKVSMVMSSSIHKLPIHDIEHLLDTGKLTVTFLVDDFFVTAEFTRKAREYYMEVRGICRNVVRIEHRDNLVALLLALVFDECIFTPNVVDDRDGGGWTPPPAGGIV